MGYSVGYKPVQDLMKQKWFWCRDTTRSWRTLL